MTETTPTVTYCYAHPDRETTLRCKRCDQPMCASCARRTPTGYVCKDCVRAHQKSFDTSEWYDYIFRVSCCRAFFRGRGGISCINLLGSIGFIGWFLAVSAAPVAGTTNCRSCAVCHQTPSFTFVIYYSSCRCDTWRITDDANSNI